MSLDLKLLGGELMTLFNLVFYFRLERYVFRSTPDSLFYSPKAYKETQFRNNKITAIHKHIFLLCFCSSGSWNILNSFSEKLPAFLSCSTKRFSKPFSRFTSTAVYFGIWWGSRAKTCSLQSLASSSVTPAAPTSTWTPGSSRYPGPWKALMQSTTRPR